MFFILSTGRSGTMTIARTLSHVKGCKAVHEPSPELILESSAYHYGKFPQEKLREILIETRKPVVDGSVYCESNQTLSLMIPLLVETFPEARYIWLIRNGMDVVASTMQKQWYTGHSENHGRYEDCSPIEKAWIDGRIEGDRCGDMKQAEWAALDRFGRCAWYWGYVNRVIEKDLNRYAPGRFKTILLEEISLKLKGLIEWMGFETTSVPTAERHNPAKRTPYHWSEWTSDERENFERFCGELMDRFYPSWRTADGVWYGVDCRNSNGFSGGFKAKRKLKMGLGGLLSRKKK